MTTIYSLKFDINGKRFPMFFESKQGAEKALELFKAFLTEKGQAEIIIQESTEHHVMSDGEVSLQVRIITQIVLDAEDELQREKERREKL